MELSIGTIVIIVLAMTLLILGMVFVRSIMCGAIGLTGDMNSQVRAELNKMFGSTSGEISCIGGGEDIVSLVPGKLNKIHCQIKSAETEGATYEFQLEEVNGDDYLKNAVKNWIADAGGSSNIGQNSEEFLVVPGDEEPKVILRMDIPDDTGAGNLYFRFSITRRVDGQRTPLSDKVLDFEVSRVGWFRAAVC